MRILFVTHNIPRFAGDIAGAFVQRLATALVADGASVEVIAPGAAGLADDENLNGIRITRVRYATPERMTLAYSGTMAEAVRGSLGGQMALLGLLRALRRETRQRLALARAEGRPIDVVHAHWWFPSALALWKLKPGRDATLPPLVITMHGSDVRLARRVRAAHPVMRAVLRNASVCAAVSSWLASQAREITGVPVRVAPMPVDVRDFVLPPAATRPRAGVLFVGRLNAQKGIADLLRAMSHDVLSDAHLDVVGDGTDAEGMGALARTLGIESRITWHGAKPPADLPPFYQRAAVVVVPSREEGLGLVAVEAQLCGAPVVAYESGGLVDVVDIDAGSALVPPGDLDALARAVAARLHVIVDPAASMRARQAMLERFAPDAAALHYRTIYDDAMRSRMT